MWTVEILCEQSVLYKDAIHWLDSSQELHIFSNDLSNWIELFEVIFARFCFNL